MADKEHHPLVMLMLARIKSHPEEFEVDTGKIPFSQRWGTALQSIDAYACEEGKRLVIEAVNTVRMDQAHMEAMDELLNGAERRAVAQAEREKAIRNTTLSYPTAGIAGKSPSQLGLDESSLLQNTSATPSAIQNYQNAIRKYQNGGLGQAQQQTTIGSLRGKSGL